MGLCRWQWQGRCFCARQEVTASPQARSVRGRLVTWSNMLVNGPRQGWVQRQPLHVSKVSGCTQMSPLRGTEQAASYRGSGDARFRNYISVLSPGHSVRPAPTPVSDHRHRLGTTHCSRRQKIPAGGDGEGSPGVKTLLWPAFRAWQSHWEGFNISREEAETEGTGGRSVAVAVVMLARPGGWEVAGAGHSAPTPRCGAPRPLRALLPPVASRVRGQAVEATACVGMPPSVARQKVPSSSAVVQAPQAHSISGSHLGGTPKPLGSCDTHPWGTAPR